MAIVLVAGTINAIFPSSSFFMTEVDALSDYGMQNNYKSSKDSSKKVSINKIKCINDNININGENSGDVNAGDNGLTISASSFGNNERYYDGHNKKDKGFDCVVNNDNENRQVTLLPNEPTPTPPCNVTVDTITGLVDIPQGIAYDPVNQRMYVTNANDDIISVIDTTTNTAIDTDPTMPGINPIPVGDFPFGIAYDPVNHRMYVTNSVDDTISVINLCPRP